jgi:flavin-dependent dehydrogenase
MTPPARVDAEVIVVGGGPAGSALAFRLARAGCDVLLVDRAAFPRDKPCSEYLSPQAGRLLEDMGVLSRLEQEPSARLRGMRITAPDASTFAGSFSRVPDFTPFRPWGLATRRTILDHTLLMRAREAGVRVRERVLVRDLEWEGMGRGSADHGFWDQDRGMWLKVAHNGSAETKMKDRFGSPWAICSGFRRLRMGPGVG